MFLALHNAHSLYRTNPCLLHAMKKWLSTFQNINKANLFQENLDLSLRRQDSKWNQVC